MQVKVVLSQDGTITRYAIIGNIEGSSEINIPDNTDISILSHAKWDGTRLIELPMCIPETLPTLEERTSALEAAMLELMMGGSENV